LGEKSRAAHPSVHIHPGDYTALAGHAVSRDFYGKPRRFCGYEDLLAMKRAAIATRIGSTSTA
jgi:hypothetical protein